MANDEMIGFEFIEYQRTSKAILVSDGDDLKVWLPLSQIKIEPEPCGEIYGKPSLQIWCPKWLAMAKQLMPYRNHPINPLRV